MRQLAVIIGVITTLLVAFVGAAALFLPDSQFPTERAPPEAVDLTYAPLPQAPPDAPEIILTGSPFSPSRRPFSRTTPPDEHLAIKLMAVTRLGSIYRATLQINGAPLIVAVGDLTPAGSVISIDDDAVTLEGQPPRKIELFPTTEPRP